MDNKETLKQLAFVTSQIKELWIVINNLRSKNEKTPKFSEAKGKILYVSFVKNTSKDKAGEG
ncbi:hypothetical protein [Parabacteroides distasonis]|uniref:Uncharacterized protein n=1 Tax=Parabacteroides distasonis TaxID=823 RepID=A0A4S2EJM4_PARDI|nr:hypothetical protein [Parabacteroides distasonis]TGY54663.1 hypothetical protein E5342_16685 [Parabacteroides distasonis]